MSSRASSRSSRSSSATSFSSRSSSRSRSRSKSVSSRSRSGSPASAKSRSRSNSPAGSDSSKSSFHSKSLDSRSPSPAVKQKLKVKLKGTKGKGRKNSQDDSDSDNDDNKSAPSPPRRGRKPKNAVKSKKTKAKKESEEEGELNSDNESANEFDDGLDDDLIGDDEDRARLENMTEKEREEELFKRAENRENLKKRFEIQKKLRQQKLKEKPQKRDSSKGSSSEEDEVDYSTMFDAKERSQDRRKNLDAQKFDKKSSALSELKAKKQERERKELERKKKEQEQDDKKDDSDSSDDELNSRKVRRDSSSSGSGSFRSRSSSASSFKSRSSGHGDSDTERFQKTSKKGPKYVDCKEDLEPIRFSRFKMEKFVNLPFFGKLVTGGFVRIGIGLHEGRHVYRCTEIIDVVETAKIYNLGKTRTNLGLKLRLGKDSRVFRLEFISNSPFTISEFQKWKETCTEHNISLPTKDFVQTKKQEIDKAFGYEFSHGDIDALLQKKEKFRKNPTNYAMTKARYLKEKEIANAEHDIEKASEVEQKLQDLEQRAEEADKRRTENTQISFISLINNRNRKNNVMKAEQAIQEEIKRKQMEGVEDNPFTRRKCNPRMVTKVAKPNEEMTSEMFLSMMEKQKKESDSKETLKTKTNSLDINMTPKRKTENKTEPTKKKSRLGAPLAMKDDLFDVHNFDIEIDVGASLPLTLDRPAGHK